MTDDVSCFEYSYKLKRKSFLFANPNFKIKKNTYFLTFYHEYVKEMYKNKTHSRQVIVFVVPPTFIM